MKIGSDLESGGTTTEPITLNEEKNPLVVLHREGMDSDESSLRRGALGVRQSSMLGTQARGPRMMGRRQRMV